ncbi:MAG: sensor domain-containing diguanylate cyclase, partial [Angelakisella sp.]
MTESFSDISVAVSMGFLATIFVVAYIRMLLKNAKNKAKLIEVSSRYEDLLKNIQGGVITCIFDKKTHSSKAVYISSGWTALTGYTLEDLKKECSGNPQALVYPEDRELANSAYMEQTAKGDTYKLQYRVVCKDGTVIWVIDRGVITTDANGAVYNQSIVTEVTEIKEKEEELLRMAQTDSLTGLYNKTTSAALAINTLEAQHDSLHALMILDIDNFKGINDSLGHIFGDTVLIEVSARLQQQMGPQDIIARIGGDEFMVLMTNINSCEEVEQKAEAICATFRNTYMGEHGSYKISCSMGIAFSTQGNGFKDLFEKADSTMYRAKTMGKDQYLVYNSAEDDGRFLGPGRMDIAPEKDSGGLEIKERFFELLYGSVDFAGSMNMALSLLGRIMDVGRVYVFENSHDNRLSSNTYEWCATGVASLQKKLQAVHLQDLDYLHLFDENGIFCCNDLSTLQSNSL